MLAYMLACMNETCNLTRLLLFFVFILLVQVHLNVLTHKYSAAIHFKLLHIRSHNQTFLYVIHYPCHEIIVHMNKTTMGTLANISSS